MTHPRDALLSLDTLQVQLESLRTKLETAHKRQQLILSHLSDGLLFVSREGVILLINEAAETILGLSTLEVMNSSFHTHFADDLFGFSMRGALQDQKLPSRLILSLSNKKEIEVAPSWVPGEGVLLLLSDRTELKQLETSVHHADRLRALGEMAATLAHEIRNPLGGIEGFAALLERELNEPSQRKKVQAILEGSRTLNALVTSVLDYARPCTLHFAQADLAQLIQEGASLAAASGFPCKVTLETHSHFKSVDRERVKLVLLNLIRNAFEANADHVEIRLTPEGEIIVDDSGEGMTLEQKEKLFTPFFTTKTCGTGLGLSEVDKVIRAHGGKITVDSKIGKGTRITLSFYDT